MNSEENYKSILFKIFRNFNKYQIYNELNLNLFKFQGKQILAQNKFFELIHNLFKKNKLKNCSCSVKS